jgi:hypothetical protein
MSAAFCLMRLGAPHAGHAGLVSIMLSLGRAKALVLVGAADVSGRPDVPLPWEERRDILRTLVAAVGIDATPLRFAPLPERDLVRWDPPWCDRVRETCRAALGTDPTDYVSGDDDALEDLSLLAAAIPGLALRRIPRLGSKSGRELRAAIASSDPLLRAKYAFELARYPASAIDRIASISASCLAPADRDGTAPADRDGSARGGAPVAPASSEPPSSSEPPGPAPR